MISILIFFIFIHVVLLIPGYVLASKIKLINKVEGLSLIFGYVFSIAYLAISALAIYLGLSSFIILVFTWILIAYSLYLFVMQKIYKNLWKYRFPLICMVLLSLLACIFVSLRYTGDYVYIPDPQPLPQRNYETMNVKILNISQTNANDNYIPYRQAQFFLNRSDPGKDSFINEWGVHFFQRTPLMGSVTAGIFAITNEKLPIDYTWASGNENYENSYIKFQILAHVLNALFIVPAYFLIKRLFNNKIASISSLFLISSPFFIYNSVYTWPKSFVAFFVLTLWLLIFIRKLRYTILSAIIAGFAYLSHDLAVFYIAASMVLLLYQKRVKDLLYFTAITLLFILPWIILSSVIYKKPSTFALYPFSTKGLPQPGQNQQIMKDFLATRPWEIISIRFDTLFYLLSPYDAIYSNGGQSIVRRIWAVGLFSIPGSVGTGLIIPALLGIYKLFRRIELWILIFIPILLVVLIVGWRGSRAIASLHFAQASIVLLTAVGIYFLVSLKSKIWLLAVFSVQCIQLGLFLLYSYNFKEEFWINFPDIVSLLVSICLLVTSAVLIFLIGTNRLPEKFRSIIGY